MTIEDFQMDHLFAGGPGRESSHHMATLTSHCTTLTIYKDEKGYGMKVSGDNPVYVQSVKEDTSQETRKESPFMKTAVGSEFPLFENLRGFLQFQRCDSGRKAAGQRTHTTHRPYSLIGWSYGYVHFGAPASMASQGVGLVLQYHLFPKTPNARDDMNHKAMDQIFHGTCGNRTHNSQKNITLNQWCAVSIYLVREILDHIFFGGGTMCTSLRALVALLERRTSSNPIRSTHMSRRQPVGGIPPCGSGSRPRQPMPIRRLALKRVASFDARGGRSLCRDRGPGLNRRIFPPLTAK
ncbi:unnamed protein product [Nesidiocoris tenuis]|uniref:Uncharacterized protein n=1 Tax=Nesidiocoris tenuis TaxID=355587 RepID=A0A6H5GT35_9HEMI|nr:unnamed protein product [Nesidiocoris tenuis]